MNSHTIKDVVASVRSRLLNLARRTGKPFEEILVLYALERFLFRLSQSIHKDEFILKGGLLLVVMGFPQARPTKDREIEFPTLLDMEPPVIFGYSLETVIAEKFEAALDLADLNSRMKDFYDIWALSQKFSFDGRLLQEAIIATCNRRKTAIQSDADIFSTEFIERSDKKTQWAAFTKKGMIKDAPGDLAKVMTDIRIFLLPVAQSSENDEAFQGTWYEGGPWNK